MKLKRKKLRKNEVYDRIEISKYCTLTTCSNTNCVRNVYYAAEEGLETVVATPSWSCPLFRSTVEQINRRSY